MIYFYLCMRGVVYTCEIAVARGGQQGVLNNPGAGLIVVSHPVWVL